MNLQFLFIFFNCEKSISHQHTIFISAECPFHTLGLQVPKFQYHKNFIGLQRSIGQQNRCNYKFQKIIKKNNPIIKTNFGTCKPHNRVVTRM